MQLPHVNFSVQVDIISVRDNDKERCAKKIANVGKVASAVCIQTLLLTLIIF